VLKFPVHPAPRLPWDDPDPNTADDVRELIALAPELGRRNPATVPNVVNYVRTMIAAGSDGGVERDRPRRVTRDRRLPTQVRRLAKLTMADVFERIHVSDPARQAEMRPLIRAYLKAHA
jgi:hypothetical protein